jgi:hypothetical protein
MFDFGVTVFAPRQFGLFHATDAHSLSQAVRKGVNPAF